MKTIKSPAPYWINIFFHGNGDTAQRFKNSIAAFAKKWANENGVDAVEISLHEDKWTSSALEAEELDIQASNSALTDGPGRS